MTGAVGRAGAAERRLWAVYLSGGFGLSISAMLGLLVPLRAAELGIPVAAIGAVVAARSLAETVLTVPLSELITRLGSRGAFVLATGACAAVSAAFVLAEGFWSLLALNALVGATRSLGWVSSQAHVSSEGAPEHRARDTGRFSFVSNAGQVVTPLLTGGAAALVGYRAAFLVIAAYALLFVLVGLALPRPVAAGGGQRVRLRAAAGLFRLPRMQIAMLLTFVRLWVPNIWTPLFPLLLVAAGASAPLAGAVLSSAAVVATAVNLLTGRLSRLAAPEVLCAGALAAAVLGLVLSPFLLDVPWVFLPAALVGIGNGLSLPLLIVLVGDAAPPGQKGLALATRNAVNALASTLGPLGTGALLAAVGAGAAFSVAGALAGLLLAGVAGLHRSAGRREGATEDAAQDDDSRARGPMV